jgi:phage terminase large subunit
MTILDLELPSRGWEPRPHQKRLWHYLENGGKRAIAIWHRRAGKDEVAIHRTACAAAERPGNYWHALPEYQQCRKAIWSAVNPHTGRRRIDEAFPLEWRAATNDSEMAIRFKTGSTWQLIGSDQYNRLVGASPAGIVFSEYALANPAAWAYFRPMLEENNGWALFITTPRGHNHAKALYDYARQEPGWFTELLTVRDTGALSDKVLEISLKEMIALYGLDAGTAMFDQEYLCSFTAALLGSFYAREMQDVRAEGRVTTDVNAIAEQPVHRSWDLGMRDSTAIWFFQVVGTQVFILDCFEAAGMGLEYYAAEIEKRHKINSWTHGNDYVPHDAKVRELGTGRTRVETMKWLGLAPILAPDEGLLDGINAARRTLPMCVFHPRCEAGLSALEQYRREWDDERKVFKPSPLHDWSSNYADSFRYLSLSWRKAPGRVIKPPPQTGWRIPPPEERRRKGLRL